MPRAGLPSLIDQPTFDARHLPPLPGGLDGFTVLSVDTARLYDQFVASLKVMGAPGSGIADQVRAAVDQAVGVKLREELLAALGPRFVCYTVPIRVNAATNPLAGFAQGMVFVPRLAIVVEVRDRQAVARALDARRRASTERCDGWPTRSAAARSANSSGSRGMRMAASSPCPPRSCRRPPV